MWKHVPAPRWIISALAAGLVLTGAILLLQTSMPKHLEEGTPPYGNVEFFDFKRHCDEAHRLFDYLDEFAAANRSCVSSEDCQTVPHPVGCSTVISVSYVAEYGAIRERVAQEQAATFGGCSLPIARCGRSYAPVCAGGECTIWQRPWSPAEDGNPPGHAGRSP